MKQIGLAAVGSVLLSTGAIADGAKDGKVFYKADKELSTVAWTGKKVTGQHHGNVSLEDGEVVVKDGLVLAVGIKLDMRTIDNGDLSVSAWNSKLVVHLKSEDFFSVEKYPYAVFVANDLTPLESVGEGDENYMVKGNLTIKGITHEISFPAKVEVNDSKLTASGKATIDRTKYDIRYGSGSFFKGLGDNMIYNDFEIAFELVANVAETELEAVEQ